MPAARALKGQSTGACKKDAVKSKMSTWQTSDHVNDHSDQGSNSQLIGKRSGISHRLAPIALCLERNLQWRLSIGGSVSEGGELK